MTQNKMNGTIFACWAKRQNLGLLPWIKVFFGIIGLVNFHFAPLKQTIHNKNLWSESVECDLVCVWKLPIFMNIISSWQYHVFVHWCDSQVVAFVALTNAEGLCRHRGLYLSTFQSKLIEFEHFIDMVGMHHFSCAAVSCASICWLVVCLFVVCLSCLKANLARFRPCASDFPTFH